ncbi:MAG: hypothetical protein ACLRWQ_10410 [Flavonifractor plautii]
MVGARLAGFGSQIQAARRGRADLRSSVAPAASWRVPSAPSWWPLVGRRRPERLLWCLSATLTACASFSGAAVLRPCRGTACAAGLSSVGAAIAGWDR